VPALDERKVLKAATLPVDEIVLDLEDAVPPERKDEARQRVVDIFATADHPLAARRVAVRVNAPQTPWNHLDLLACCSGARRPASVVVPKVESAADLGYVDRLLAGGELHNAGAQRIGVQALIETAAGLTNIDEIAGATDRLQSLILGYADLRASLGRDGTEDLETWLPYQAALILAAKTSRVAAIDGPHLSTSPGGEFLASAARARHLGFDGKWVIHPSQVDALNQAFAPTPSELRRARAVLAAMDSARSEGMGAAQLDGQMIDEAVARWASRVVVGAGG
jgi:citrate lyase subunit beta/citryl-CoA lyase